ncbi:hypothetical protein BAE44_0011842 [Dichanthelium oligosanthes]|uniref:Uncharacterized protein n=1 Tax=Dichanthelium oligosanthes TaxID=888268 RepID=A0A1E5VPS8_9POAL|nr:hypothetical protein BAE44_0011842 [Dichanthelium oligosanthes]
MWLSAPLNLDLRSHPIPLGEVLRILSSHRGPGRRFSTPARFCEELRGRSAVTLDGWLRSTALDNLEVLDFRYDMDWGILRCCPHQRSASRALFASPDSGTAVSRMESMSVCRFSRSWGFVVSSSRRALYMVCSPAALPCRGCV